MAGRRKKQENLTREEQLEIVDKEIEECKESLKRLKEKRKEIVSQIEEAKKVKLKQAVTESGRRIEEFLKALTRQEEKV